MQEEVLDIIKKHTNHEYVRITSRGNSAIFIALIIAQKASNKNTVLIPDQGGWFSYKTYPRIIGMNFDEVKTDKGLIDLKDLDEKAKKASAFIFTSFAGYFAEQDLESISKICKERGCLLIEDASGSLFDDKLCNGQYSDIIVCSFGRWKPVNLGYGGFISCNNNDYFENFAKEAFSISKVHNGVYSEVIPFLNDSRYKKLLELASNVKEDLKDYNIYHRDKRGLDVVTEYNEEIIKYCEEKGYPYILCPSYIRINEKAISIELKRLDL